MHLLSRCLLVVAVLSVVGCTRVKETHTPDGRVGYTVDCSGEYLTWARCYEKAGDLCGARGYDLLQVAGDPRGAAFATSTMFYASSGSTRSMLIACKGP